jgi:hypothetical protein
MKMTLEIDDDLIAAASDVAKREDRAVEDVVLDFARRGIRDRPLIAFKNGIPVMMRGPGSKVVTSEMVRELMEDEFDIPPRR